MSIIVVGAGIVGASAAFHLTQFGADGLLPRDVGHAFGFLTRLGRRSFGLALGSAIGEVLSSLLGASRQARNESRCRPHRDPIFINKREVCQKLPKSQ